MMLTQRELALLREGDNPVEVHRAIATLAQSVAKAEDRTVDGLPTRSQWDNVTVSLRLLRELL